MKFKTFLAAIFAVILAACGGGEAGTDNTAPPNPPSPTTKVTSGGATDFTKFQEPTSSAIGEWFWLAATVHDESVLPIAGKTDYTLMRDIVRVISVRNRQTGQTYTPVTDYTVSASGHLVIPAGSQIPTVPATYTSTPPDNYRYIAYRADGSPIRIASDYQLHQVAVTYEGKAYGGSFQTLTPGANNTLAKLKAGQKVAITYVGDSITYGSDTTWELNAHPQQRSYAYLVASHLESLYPGQVYMRNKAIAGTTSADGAQNAGAYVGDTPSDLIVIAYGMNDAGAGVSSATFESNLRTIMTTARAANPNCEFVLVLSWPSNPEANPQNWTPFAWYYTAVTNIASNTAGVVIANVTSPTWDYILARKSFYDMTANGINHPSDWMHTIYAQIVLKSVFGM